LIDINIHSLNIDMALAWLLEHTDDPQLDEPLTEEELEYIGETVGHALGSSFYIHT
jgi:hypothetical protein